MHDEELPITRYAENGDVNIAFQIMGNGPIDIVVVPGIVSHVEYLHEIPGYTAFLRRLSTFARVITFDKRGQGLSDKISGAPSLEERMDDVRAIMDQIGSDQAVLLAFSEGSPMSALFAATYPHRVSKLILFGGFAKANPVSEQALDERARLWGTGYLIKTAMGIDPSHEEPTKQFAKFERLSATPRAYRSYIGLNKQIDVTSILPGVRVPTLVLHRASDTWVPIGMGRELAASIPGAKFIEYPTGPHVFFTGEVDTMLGDIEEFITGSRDHSLGISERVLATVLFTDITNSTGNAASMGDLNWRRLLDRHDELAKQIISKHRGKLIKTTGDGVLATFDGPARGVRCALAFEVQSRQLGLTVRAGLHTGEIELRSNDIGGVAVHAAARVMDCSKPTEVMVSRVITDLVAGAGLQFTERGSFQLKGLPGQWDLFAAIAE
jgi:class 3 adenylate cyclase/pimeloyl-ACP methyl ester carboxylesterase